ncbi:MAG: hypothetical protein FD121_1208 [Gallionellaceae bacterium]|nr:MAG: hypothetical protein FD121_1208 [Gallionellaceae bacterium]
MDKKTVLIKTSVGEVTISGLSGDMRRVMLLIDDKSTVEEVTKRAPPSLRGDLPEILQNLIDAELIRDKDKIVVAPKIVVPKPVAAPISEELDFTAMVASPTAAAMAEEGARLKARQEVEAARLNAEQEVLRKQAELEAAAKAKAEADAARIKAEQEAARLKAEMEVAKARAEAEARAKQAEEKAKQEAEAARLKAEQEAARIKAEQEAARVKAELEAAAKAKAEAEVARIKAEQEAAKIRAELEAAKARAEAEAKALAEERARQEVEAARLKAEQEAARIKAEQEAARLKAEQEAARIKAEQEAARIRAEQEAAARAKVEADERARQEAEAARLKAEEEVARIRAEAEAARIKAEQEAAIAKAELEAAKARADAEAKALVEQRAKHEAEAARIKAEQEAARAKAEQQAAERAKTEAEAARIKAEQEAITRQAAQTEAVEKAKRDAQLAKQETLAASAAQVAQPASPFQINLDVLNAGITPVSAHSAPQEDARAKAEQEAAQRAAAEAKALEEQKTKQRAAEEMARLKEEQEAARLRAEHEARAKEEEQALAAEQASAWAEAEQRAKSQASLNVENAAHQSAQSKAKATQKPVSRARHKPLPVGKIFMGLVVLSIVTIFVLPLVWPLQEFIAPIEQRISAQLKQPVKIGSMSAAILPMPKVELQNLSIGAGEEIKVSTVSIFADPLSLFSEQKTISNIELKGATVDGRRLEQLTMALKGIGGDAQYPLRHLTIQNLKVNAEGIELPTLSGSADIAQGQFTRVVLHSDDSKFNVEVVPMQNRWQLSFGIKERALPLLPDVTFSDFTVKGLIGDGEVDFSEIDAHAYGGILSGRGKLTWRKGWQLQGRMQAKTMELEKMFPQFGLSGEVFADGSFALQSTKFSQLGDAPKFDASFSANKGVITGMDMVETARLSSREHLPGGRTHFDVLTGAVQLENHVKRFRQVKITSGMLNATGSFEMSATGQLSGSFGAEIKMRAGNNALGLSGTLNEPKLVAR